MVVLKKIPRLVTFKFHFVSKKNNAGFHGTAPCTWVVLQKFHLFFRALVSKKFRAKFWEKSKSKLENHNSKSANHSNQAKNKTVKENGLTEGKRKEIIQTIKDYDCYHCSSAPKSYRAWKVQLVVVSLLFKKGSKPQSSKVVQLLSLLLYFIPNS